MKKKSAPMIHIGIAWYRPEQYDAVRSYCKDGESMDETFEEWKAGAEKAVRELRLEGAEVLPVDFDLEEFKAWCSAKGMKPNASSRTDYTVEKLRDSDESQHAG